jgi:hypothetical protein
MGVGMGWIIERQLVLETPGKDTDC